MSSSLHPLSTNFALRPEERRAWEEDGFIIRPSVFSESELRVLREAAEQVVARAAQSSRDAESYLVDGNRYVDADGATIQFEHEPDSQTIRVIEPFHHLHSELDALIDDPRLVHPMRGLVGSKAVSLWTDKLNLKRPRDGSRFRFHQDSPYWAYDCDHVDRLPNVMIALDDAREENGCLRVVRGSHKSGLLPGIEDDSRLGPLFTDTRYFDSEHAIAAAMPAGSLLFFSPHIVHGSEPNRSDSARRAMVLTYQPAGEQMFKLDAIRNARPH